MKLYYTILQINWTKMCRNIYIYTHTHEMKIFVIIGEWIQSDYIYIYLNKI